MFEVPREIWRSGFDAFRMANGQTIGFQEYANKRGNPDFVRDFNLACGQTPHLSVLNTATEDQVHVNKGFLDSMFLDQGTSAEGQNEESKYAYLASADNLGAEETDFSDPASLLRRQRLILE